MIDPMDSTPIPSEPHDLQHRLEQAASDAVADFNLWSWKVMPSIRSLPFQVEWLTLLNSIRKLEGILAETDQRDGV